MTNTAEMIDSICQILDKHCYVQLAIVFGSTTKGTATRSSDLDIAVAGKSTLTAEQKMSLVEDLAVSLGRQIDLVDLMAASGLVLQQALSKGRCIRKKDSLLYARLVKRMLFNQADMMPYHDMILRNRRERFIYG